MSRATSALCHLASLAVLLLAQGSVFSLPTNLITNGSFETASQSPPAANQLDLAAGSTVITGWTVTGQDVEYVGAIWQASEGQRAVDLNGFGPGGMLSAPGQHAPRSAVRPALRPRGESRPRAGGAGDGPEDQRRSGRHLQR